MHIKKLLAAFTSACMAATSLIGAVSMQTSAEENDNTVIFDIRSNGENAVEISGESIQAGDFAIPVQIFIPKSMGICSMGLKLQVNDGQIADDGSFGNYGFFLSGGYYADPYCFDSNDGFSGDAFVASFNYSTMNIIWISNTDMIAMDAYAEPNTTVWDYPIWAYDYAFVECTLMVPQDTPEGDYTFDIRRERYVNSLSIGEAEAVYSATSVLGEEGALDYDTVPLKIHVGGVAQTTTTTPTPTVTTTTVSTTTADKTTTTGKTTTTTTGKNTMTTTGKNTTTTTGKNTTTTTGKNTTTTTGKTTTTTSGKTTTTTTTPITTTTTTTTTTFEAAWKDSPQVLDEGFYWNIDDVAGKAGETVQLNVYVYGDTGTAGVTAWFGYDQALQLTAMNRGKAYRSAPTINPEIYPACLAFANTQGGSVAAADGSVVISLQFQIPEDAKSGSVYPVFIYEMYDEDTESEVVDKNGKNLPVQFIAGSVTVLEGNETALNYTESNFTKAGQVLDLTVFNATDDVQWSTSDASVATVNDKGLVTCVSVGDAVITATVGEKQYICKISGGLYGDIDNSGSVDTTDATLVLLQYAKGMLGMDYLNESQKSRADVDGNGTINEVDATMILRYYASNVILGVETSWYELTGNPMAPGAPV